MLKTHNLGSRLGPSLEIEFSQTGWDIEKYPWSGILLMILIVDKIRE